MCCHFSYLWTASDNFWHFFLKQHTNLVCMADNILVWGVLGLCEASKLFNRLTLYYIPNVVGIKKCLFA